MRHAISRCFSPPLLFVILTLSVVSLLHAPPAAAQEAHDAFERFVAERVLALRARSDRARSLPEVRPGSRRPMVTYRAAGEEFETEIEQTGVRAVPLVGTLHYTEQVFSCDDVMAARCALVSSTPVTEIFRFRDGAWGH